MIPKGLKVGDTFVDGGITYKVLAVNDNGTYISKMVPKSAENQQENVAIEETAITAEKPVKKAVKASTTKRKATRK